MNLLKSLFAIFLVALLIQGCSNSDNNPASPNNNNSGTSSGTWKLNYTGTRNGNLDSLFVTLNMNFSNNIITGTADINFSQTNGGNRFATSSKGTTLGGAYKSDSLYVATSSFIFFGRKSGSDYSGQAFYVIGTMNPDSLSISNATLVSAN